MQSAAPGFAFVRVRLERSGPILYRTLFAECSPSSVEAVSRGTFNFIAARRKTYQKSVVKNSIIKRGRFEAPPLRHMMYEQCRASIHENACASATRDRARSERWHGRRTNIGQITKPFRSSCMYVAGCSSFANALSKYAVAASRPLRHTARIAHRFSMRRPLRLPIIFF